MFLDWRQRARVKPALAGALLCGVAWLAWHSHSSPRAWEVSEVPVAFWAWQSQAPSMADAHRAIEEAGAHILFLRVGQIDYEAGQLRRIRAPQGACPTAPPLHLVYNGTRSLLTKFEGTRPDELAATLAGLFAEDAARAARDGARVVGLQLDLDVPTRLLGHYKELLRELRGRIPSGIQMSITGLPTWMDSPRLEGVLAAADFWTPQCYGARIPERLDEVMPISSPEAVARAVRRARRLGRPFYVGLAAYGYAAHYGRDGKLIALRGDFDPALAARHGGLELLERRPCGEAGAAEWRLVYRAREACVIDGLTLRAGESLMLDLPSSASLRAAARAARGEAGDELRGLCVFRLPVGDDPANLTIQEIAAALRDQPGELRVTARAEGDAASRTLHISMANTGSAAALPGEGLTVELPLPAGGVSGVRLDGFTAYETLCAAAGGQAVACGVRRANLLRLRRPDWRPGQAARAAIHLNNELPASVSLRARVVTDDGNERVEEINLPVRADDTP